MDCESRKSKRGQGGKYRNNNNNNKKSGEEVIHVGWKVTVTVVTSQRQEVMQVCGKAGLQ